MRVKPMMVRRSVVLPTPFLPSTARLPCSGISSETPSSTRAGPYPARTSSSTTSGSAMASAPAPEIGLAHARVGGDLRRRAFDQDAASDHHDDPTGETKHDVHVVLDEQHRDLLRQVGNRSEQLRAFVFSHARGGLVEQQHLRSGRQRERYLEEALLAVGEFTGRPIGVFAEL